MIDAVRFWGILTGIFIIFAMFYLADYFGIIKLV